jgi:V-type H+-transporting ATPase subunit G
VDNQHTSGNKEAEDAASKDADAQVKEIKSIGDKNGDKVVEDLLKIVTEVKPEPRR